MKILIGDNLVEVEMVNGVPTIKANAKEIVHPDGRVDVVVEVPCMKITGKKTGDPML